MNRFVILFQEGYDQFNPDVPHPIQTTHSREEILLSFQNRRDAVIKWKAEYEKQTKSGKNCRWDPPCKDILLDTGMSFSSYEIGEYGVTIKVLTVEEWFDRYSNRRFNCYS